jgi:hypothetical protein
LNAVLKLSHRKRTKGLVEANFDQGWRLQVEAPQEREFDGEAIGSRSWYVRESLISMAELPTAAHTHQFLGLQESAPLGVKYLCILI